MTEKLDQKLAKRRAASLAESGPGGGHTPRSNEGVEARIAAYKAADPGFVAYLGTLSRERLENIAILRQADNQETKQRIREAADRKILQWLEIRPDIAKEISEKVAKLPAEDQNLARLRMGRAAAQREGLKTGPAVSGPKV